MAAGPDAAALFGAKCAICHDKDGRGQQKWKAKGQPDFTDTNWQMSRTDAQIADAIRDGKGKFMPAWKNKLSEEDIGTLVGRVRAFERNKDTECCLQYLVVFLALFFVLPRYELPRLGVPT